MLRLHNDSIRCGHTKRPWVHHGIHLESLKAMLSRCENWDRPYHLRKGNDRANVRFQLYRQHSELRPHIKWLNSLLVRLLGDRLRAQIFILKPYKHTS